MTARKRPFTAIACAALMAFTQLQPAFAETGNPAGNPERLAAGLDATAAALDRIAAVAPDADGIPEALAATIEGGPEALTDWVATHIAHGVYRGALKGASGTIEDRRGNSLDRALLIAALATAKGLNVRLARAALNGEAAAKLATAAATETHAPSPPMDAARVRAILDELAADPRVNGAALKEASQRAAAEAASATAEGDALTKKAADGLLALVAARLGEPADTAAAILADHWWAEVETDGAWRALDPDAALIGPQSASETFAPDAIPDAAKHRVVIRFVAETAGSDGELVRHTVLERAFQTAAVTGRILAFTAQPIDAPALDGLAARKDDIVADYVGGTAWLPVFIVDETERQNLVKADGTILEATDENVQRFSGAAAAFDRNTSGLDQIGTGEDEAEAPVPSGGLFTAAWLEFEILAPDEAPRLETRLIFDAIGPEARATGAYLGDLTEAALTARGIALRDVWSVVVQGGAIAPARAAARVALNVARARRAVAAWLREGSPDSGPIYPDDFRLPNLELTLWSLGRGDTPIAAANIAALRDTARIGENGLEITQVFDIIANPLGAGAAADRVRRGVADTVLEHQLMDAPEDTANTAIRFAADLDAGAAWGVVAPGDGAALDALGLAPDARARIEADLARGRLVVARPGTTTPQEATWWRIDPATGETVGMTMAGGSEIAEYIIAGSIWVIVFGAAIKLRCERSGGGRKPGDSYAGCAAASYGNPFRKGGEAIQKKLGGALEGVGGDALKDL